MLKIALGALALIVLVTGCAEDNASPHRPAMWTVEANGTTVYFMGSLHLLPSDLDWKDDRYHRALDEADVVVLEIDLKEAVLGALGGGIEALDRPTPLAERLPNTLTPQTYDRLRAATGAVGINPAVLDQLDAHTGVELLTMTIMVNDGFSRFWGVDYAVAADAAARDKPVIGLETLDDQLRALDSYTSVEPNRYVNDSLDALEANPEMFNQMLAGWASGELTGTMETFIADMENYPEIYDALIVNRNRHWVETIDGWLQAGGRTFFVVAGAGHFVGPDSVNAMLDAKGYTVERF